MTLPKDTCVPYNNSYRSVARIPAVIHEHVPEFIVEKTQSIYTTLNSEEPDQNYEIINQPIQNTTDIKELTSLMLQFMEEWGVDTQDWDSALCILKCKSAAYHNDPVKTNVAFVNWYVAGPTAFLHTDHHIEELHPGDIVIFDPYCPHALTLHSSRLDSHQPNSSSIATFIALEVPLESVLHLLSIKKMKQVGTMMSRDDYINPQTGEWAPSRNNESTIENLSF